MSHKILSDQSVTRFTIVREEAMLTFPSECGRGRSGRACSNRVWVAVVSLCCFLVSAFLASAASASAMYPVLFVHGSGLSSATWQELRVYLVDAGYPETYLRAVDMQPRHGSNPRAARRYIAPAVEALLRDARRHARTAGLQSPTQVDIVAHSMGAISSRWYLAVHRPDKIRRWIGIAPANHGTNALCGHTGSGDRELCPAFAANSRQSSVQFRLNGGANSRHDETPYGLGLDRPDVERVPPEERRAIAYYTLRIDPDPWIVPAESAVLDGAGGLHLSVEDRVFRETSPGNFLFLGAAGHDELPKDPRVIDWVRAVLTAEEPEC